MTENVWSARHPSVKHYEALFAWSHLPPHLAMVSRPFADTAREILALVTDGQELSACLRKLLEAKDCAVRQAVIDWNSKPSKSQAQILQEESEKVITKMCDDTQAFAPEGSQLKFNTQALRDRLSSPE